MHPWRSGLELNVCRKGLEAQNKKNQNTFVKIKGLLLFYILISLFQCEIKRDFQEKKKKSDSVPEVPVTFSQMDSEMWFNQCLLLLCEGKRVMNCLNCSASWSESPDYVDPGGYFWLNPEKQNILLGQIYLWDLPKAKLGRGPDPKL